MEKDGGFAFPQLAIESQERDGHGDTMEPFTSSRGGMSLRDWFAGQALTGLCAAEPPEWQRQREDGGRGGKMLATSAYIIADAMLDARKS